MKQKDLLFFLLSATFVVALWIVFSILHATLSTTITSDTAQDIAPINSRFDTKTLTLLKKRAIISPQTAVAISPSPTPLPTTVPITPVSPLQSLSVPIASQGGKTQ